MGVDGHGEAVVHVELLRERARREVDRLRHAARRQHAQHRVEERVVAQICLNKFFESFFVKIQKYPQPYLESQQVPCHYQSADESLFFRRPAARA